MKHSPGPWGLHPAYTDNEPLIVKDPPGPSWIAHDMPIVDCNGVTLCEAVSWTCTDGGFPRVQTSEQMLANARLIAAAPTLLDALRKIHDNPDGARIIAAAAIKEAEGG